MFNCWKEAEGNKRDEAIPSTSFECNKNDFIRFFKQFLGEKFSVDKAADVFMHNLREGSQLKNILRQISDTLSPKNSLIGQGMDDTMENFGQLGGVGNRNNDLF